MPHLAARAAAGRFRAQHLAIAAGQFEPSKFDFFTLLADAEASHASGEAHPRQWLTMFKEDSRRMPPTMRMTVATQIRDALRHAEGAGLLPVGFHEIAARDERDHGFRLLLTAGQADLVLRVAQATDIVAPLGFTVGDPLQIEYRPTPLIEAGWRGLVDGAPLPILFKGGGPVVGVYLEFENTLKQVKGFGTPATIADAWREEVQASLESAGLGQEYSAVVPPGFDLAMRSPHRSVAVVVAPAPRA